MPKIHCTLENAALEISGVKFIPHPEGDGLISEADVGEPQLSIFMAIPGYAVLTEPAAINTDAATAKNKETAAERKARLKSEAEAEAAASAPAAPAMEPAADPVVAQEEAKPAAEFF